MRLGEILIEKHLITGEDLDRALELQRERGEKLGKILVDLGFIAARDVLLGAVRAVAGAAAHDRRSARRFARNRNALAQISAPVPLPAGGAARSHGHAGDGRSAGFRDAHRRWPPAPG